ncbi:hypothetical protein [Arthrobacter sp. CAL618]|uniref:hypothetical protein n=1 Tax=Arthrobacter sp. CAL618 TaxID=1055770 RepID=UPI00040F9F5E|nr:hypothetical protein [Arthrobacter sp. CAL618]
MNFRLPHLASQLQIEQWASRYDARSSLPNLTRRLIVELVPNVTELSMEGDEHVDFSGFDGLVTSPIKTPFVPAGRSVWEFGASGDPRTKAKKDYDKRTKEAPGVDRASTTFVFVTPQRWAGGHDWAKEKADLGEWKDVVVHTSADLYAALEISPRTHIWFSEEIGIPSNGVCTLSDWWERFTADTNGLITPELLLAGRTTDASQLLTRLLNSGGSHIWVGAPSTDDVLAFVAAVIKNSDPETRQVLLERALVVFDPGALLFLGQAEGLLILVPFEESLIRHADLVRGHHVVMHTTNEAKATFSLAPIPINDSEDMLAQLGVEMSRRSGLGRALNKSLPLYKQAVTGTMSTSIAAASENFAVSHIARRACLLGSWNFDHAGDAAMVEQITGRTTAEVEEELQQWTQGPAPAFSRVGSAWKIFDPAQSFIGVAPLLTKDDFQTLETAVQEVLGAVDPKLDLAREDRWKAGLEGKLRAHSTDLRKGIARTLALMAAAGDGIGSGVPSQSIRSWSLLLTRAVLQRANEDYTGRLWESLLDVLSLLAEAAPDIFLAELEVAVKKDGPLDGKIFLDSSNDFLSPASPHTYVLWSLEVLAWSSMYFGGSSALLMTLAEQDPGGKLSNRPVRSLVNVFTPWHPQTAASLKSRNAVLSKIARTDTKAAWDVVVSLLPDAHAIAMDNSGPEFHDWKDQVLDSKVTMGSYVESVAHVVKLCTEMARTDPRRLVTLVDKIDDLTPELRTEVLGVFQDFAEEDGDETTKEMVWKSLTSLIRRHRKFSDAQWALDEPTLQQLDVLAQQLEPGDQSEKVEWLFDYHPDLGNPDPGSDFDVYQKELERRQIEAVEMIYGESGLAGLIELARKVKTPWSLGYAAASSSFKLDLDEVTSRIVDEDPAICEFATSAIRNRFDGDTAGVIALSARHGDSPLIAARVLRIADDLPKAWKAAYDSGPTTDKLYWSEFVTFGRGGDFNLVNETATKLAEHGRVAVALDLLAIYSHNSSDRVDPSLVARLIGDFVSASDTEAAVLSQYDLASLLDYVRKSDVVSGEELGLLEWKLLPALDHSANVEALQALMASVPEFFVQIIACLYRRETGEDDIENSKALARNAWDLLHRWRVVPGSKTVGGEIDEEVLSSWVNRTRELLLEADRLDVGEAHIGQVFAHARPDGDIWPALAVRNFLDTNSTEVIDRNFVVGIHNKRGVTSRGMTEGGDQERALAAQYEVFASQISDEWPKTARLLRRVVEGYREEARRNDEEAQRIQEGFDL